MGPLTGHHAMAGSNLNGTLEFAWVEMPINHAYGRFINLDFKSMFMELDQKVRYAMIAFAAVSVVLAGLGLHAAAGHLKALEMSGVSD